MINFKKGSGLTLEQCDRVGLAKDSEAVVAGMICYIDTSNQVVKGISGAAANDKLLGFALQTQTDSDVLASGKIGLALLDSGMIVETDQYITTSTGAFTANSTAVGTEVGAETTSGKLRIAQSGDAIIGFVEGWRQLPGTSSVTQNYVDNTGATKSVTMTVPTAVWMLSVKIEPVRAAAA